MLDTAGNIKSSVDAFGYRTCIANLPHDSTEKALQHMALAQSLGMPAKNYTDKCTIGEVNAHVIVAHSISNEVVDILRSTLIFEDHDEGCEVDLSTVENAEVVSIEDVKLREYSYDVETESDRFDVSGIYSHNCRTRVVANVYDPTYNKVTGRGNLSFTSINLPRLGIKASGDVDKFFEMLDDMMELVHRQLISRFKVQCRKHPRNYPFLMGQGVWYKSDELGPDDDITEILKHGTLTVGFIGLAECLKALIGVHHGESEEAQELGLKIVGHMRELTDKWSEEEHLNYSVIATPQWGTCDCKTA
jgi:hypothetical protein